MRIPRPTLQPKQNKMLKLYVCSLSEVSSESLENEYLKQSQTVRQHLESKKNRQGRELSLLALYLLRCGISELFGIEDYNISYTKNGKPQLSFCHFSLAHSKDTAVCVISNEPVGVDIEFLRLVKRRESYRFFTPNECRYVNDAQGDISKKFFEIWTKKEAYVKLLGTKLIDSADVDVTEISNVDFTLEKHCSFTIAIARLR